MKKLIAMLLALVMVASMVACGSKKDEAPEKEDTQIETNVDTETPAEGDTTEPEVPTEGEEETAEPEVPAEGEETTEEAPEEEIPADEEVAMSPEATELMETMNKLIEGMPEELMTMETEVTPDTFEYYTFVPYVDGAVSVVSEAMIGSIAHSIVLVKLPEGADVEAFAADMDANKNPAKWICVAAEESYVKTNGQYILLVMAAKENADIVAANWDAAFGA